MNSLISVRRLTLAILLGALISVSSVYAVSPAAKADAVPEVPKLFPVAQVIWVKGKVSAEQPNQPARILERRSPIFEKDILTTDKNSSAQIAFTDSGLVSLRSDTQLRIDKFAHKKGAPAVEEKSVMSLIKGGFRTITGVVPKENPEGYQVNTPVATIGVRGTDYSIFYDGKELAAKIDFGKIAIQNQYGIVELDKDLDKLYSTVSGNQAPKMQSSLPAKTFEGQPAIQPVSSKTIDSIGVKAIAPPIGGGGSNTGGPGSTVSPSSAPSSGPAKTVSNFCIGLLKDVNEFFRHLLV